MPVPRRMLLKLAGIATMTIPLLTSRKVIAADVEMIEQPGLATDRAFIDRAFALRRQAVESGDQGYGAVVVRDGKIVGQSPSHVVVHRDPTAHAEMEAIRDAARRLGNRDLSNCTLFSSSPACPMCEAAAYWAGIERMVSGKAVQDGGSPRLCGQG